MEENTRKATKQPFLSRQVRQDRQGSNLECGGLTPLWIEQPKQPFSRQAVKLAKPKAWTQRGFLEGAGLPRRGGAPSCPGSGEQPKNESGNQENRNLPKAMEVKKGEADITTHRVFHAMENFFAYIFHAFRVKHGHQEAILECGGNELESAQPSEHFQQKPVSRKGAKTPRGVAAPLEFSTLWKTFPQFFHAMEDFFPHCGKSGLFFPHYGRIFDAVSMLWIPHTRDHGVEKRGAEP